MDAMLAKSIGSFVIQAFTKSAKAVCCNKKERELQENLAQENRKLMKQLEDNRLDFQLKLNESNARMQKELSLQSHALRLEEQRLNFENMRQLKEWEDIMNSWPLYNRPIEIRQEQLLPDQTVALMVIFSKSNDDIFEKFIYPSVEHGLRSFVDLYHNKFHSKNLVFYHNGFQKGRSGDSVDIRIHHVLKELPVLIIDSNVDQLHEEITVSFSMWGLGNSEKSHLNVFTIPYQETMKDGNIDKTYYRTLTAKILSYLKFVLGYAYDAYNLIQYDRPPLLPQVAVYEKENEIRGALLAEPEVQAVFAEKYGEIYQSVIGSNTGAFAQLPEAFPKASVLHELRMEYAQAVKDCVTQEQYIQYLNESLDAWVALRTTRTTPEFLKDLISDALPIKRYFSETDKNYIKTLYRLYVDVENEYFVLIQQVCSKVDQVSSLDSQIDVPTRKAPTNSNVNSYQQNTSSPKTPKPNSSHKYYYAKVCCPKCNKTITVSTSEYTNRSESATVCSQCGMPLQYFRYLGIIDRNDSAVFNDVSSTVTGKVSMPKDTYVLWNITGRRERLSAKMFNSLGIPCLSLLNGSRILSANEIHTVKRTHPKRIEIVYITKGFRSVYDFTFDTPGTAEVWFKYIKDISERYN